MNSSKGRFKEKPKMKDFKFAFNNSNDAYEMSVKILKFIKESFEK